MQSYFFPYRNSQLYKHKINKTFLFLISTLLTPLFHNAQVQGKHTYTVQLQGAFLSRKHYPAIALEGRLTSRNIFKITLGGGFVASTKYKVNLIPIDISTNSYYVDGYIPAYDIYAYSYKEQPIKSISHYRGAILKVTQLYIFNRNKKKISEFSGGLDVGLYILNDHYKQTIVNYKTNEQRSISGSYKSTAMSIGYTIGVKKTFHKIYFANAFANLAYYTPDINKFLPPFNIYGEKTPFAWFKYEIGIGIGYTFFKDNLN